METAKNHQGQSTGRAPTCPGAQTPVTLKRTGGRKKGEEEKRNRMSAGKKQGKGQLAASCALGKYAEKNDRQSGAPEACL